MKKTLISIIVLIVISLAYPRLNAKALDTGNGLFAEYFQYKNAEYAFSARTKRYEVSGDTVDKSWKSAPVSIRSTCGIGTCGSITYSTLKVSTLSTGTAGTTVKYVYKDRMAVRWTGKIKVSSTTTVKFRIRGNGGAYILVRDGSSYLEADNWKDIFLSNLFAISGTILTSASKKLTANVYYPIVIEYMNYDGNANILLQWSKDGGSTWQNVPKSVLYSSNSNRTISIKTLDEERILAVKTIAAQLQSKIDKNYLLDSFVNVAQDAALDMLGARTKKLAKIAIEVLTPSYQTSIQEKLGKATLSLVSKPISTAYDFMSIFKNIILLADDATNSDDIRAIVYLTLRENPSATLENLPIGIAEVWATDITLKYGNLGFKDVDKIDSNTLNNIGKWHGTMTTSQVNEFVLLTMTAILESYVFQYNLMKLVAQ